MIDNRGNKRSRDDDYSEYSGSFSSSQESVISEEEKFIGFCSSQSSNNSDNLQYTDRFYNNAMKIHHINDVNNNNSKRIQLQKITSEAHQRTISMMMNASKELSRSEKHNKLLSNVMTEINQNPTELDESVSTLQSQYQQYRQSPYW